MSKKELDKKLIKLTYNAVIKEIDNSTRVKLSDEEIHNTILNEGKNIVRDLIGGLNSQGAFTHIAIGTDGTASNATDTDLGAEVTRATATVTAPGDYQVKFEKVFTFGSGESYSIQEAGLFDGESGSDMLNRIHFSTKSVDADTDLSVTITITVG